MQHGLTRPALLASAAVAGVLAAAGPARAATVDLTLSCASATGAGTPTVQVQFIAGYGRAPAWIGVVQTTSGERQLAQVGLEVPPLYNKGRCRRVATRVPLAPKGVLGPPTRFDTFTTCRVSSRALVRIHATVDGRHVLAAAVVVRTSSGALAAWASIGKNGKGGLLTSGRCMS